LAPLTERERENKAKQRSKAKHPKYFRKKRKR